MDNFTYAVLQNDVTTAPNVEIQTPSLIFRPMERQKAAVLAALKTMQGLSADQILQVFRDAAFEAASKNYSEDAPALHEVACKLLAASETPTGQA